jgi:hypothetical protein
MTCAVITVYVHKNNAICQELHRDCWGEILLDCEVTVIPMTYNLVQHQIQHVASAKGTYVDVKKV